MRRNRPSSMVIPGRVALTLFATTAVTSLVIVQIFGAGVLFVVWLVILAIFVVVAES